MTTFYKGKKMHLNKAKKRYVQMLLMVDSQLKGFNIFSHFYTFEILYSEH